MLAVEDVVVLVSSGRPRVLEPPLSGALYDLPFLLRQVVNIAVFRDRWLDNVVKHGYVAVYMTVGWYDIFAVDMFCWYDNLSVPKRLVVRPTDHSHGRNKGTWQTCTQWPPPGQRPIVYYFGPRESGSIASVNDGTLALTSPTTTFAADTCTVDYTATTGTKSRWAAIEEPHEYPDLLLHEFRWIEPGLFDRRLKAYEKTLEEMREERKSA